MKDFEDDYVTAARLDPKSLCLNEKRTLFGASILKGAFDTLQLEPWHLSPYQSARLVHFAVSRRTKESAVDATVAFAAYVESRPAHVMLDAVYDRARCVCQRAGVLDPQRIGVLLPLAAWFPDAALLLQLVAPHPPSKHVHLAFEAEMKQVKKALWSR